MKEQEKIDYLYDNHFSLWLTTRSKISDELSAMQSTFCVCGKLATGLHETSCRKFNKKINTETVKKLEHLIECK